jgi:hypothetical protein
MDRLPPAKLYRASLPDCPRAPCLICGTPVRGDFQPIYGSTEIIEIDDAL